VRGSAELAAPAEAYHSRQTSGLRTLKLGSWSLQHIEWELRLLCMCGCAEYEVEEARDSTTARKTSADSMEARNNERRARGVLESARPPRSPWEKGVPWEGPSCRDAAASIAAVRGC